MINSKRIRFFLTHLSVSMLFSLLILIWIFCVWYPAPLAKSLGIFIIVLMMLAIDVILGPLLGFLVYKDSKKNLKFDLGIIIGIQILALLYGMYTIYNARPVWIVYNNDHFDLVQRFEIITDNLENSQKEFKEIPFLGPCFSAVESRKISQKIEDVTKGISIIQHPDKYVTLETKKNNIIANLKPLEKLTEFNSKESVDAIFSKYPEADAWLPLKTTMVDMVVLMDKKSFKVIKIVDLRPF